MATLRDELPTDDKHAPIGVRRVSTLTGNIALSPWNLSHSTNKPARRHAFTRAISDGV